MAFSDIANLE